MKKLIFYSVLLLIASSCQQLAFRKIVKNSSCTSVITAPQVEKDIIFLQNYIQRRPKHQQARYILAMRYYRQQNFQKSIATWDDLIQLNPRHALGVANRGVCYFFLKNKAAAHADFQRAIELGFDEPIMSGKTLSEYLTAQPNTETENKLLP